MKQNMPKTPFSMSLSRSAKETELRLRNIFQWKKKRPPVIALVAAVLVVVFCGSLVGFAPVEPETLPLNGAATEIEWADPVVKHLVYTAYINDETEAAILENIPDGFMLWESEEVFWEYAQAVDEYVARQGITIPKEFLRGIKRFSFVNNGEYISSQFEDQQTTYVMQPVPYGIEITSLADFVHMPNLEELSLLNSIVLTDLSPLSSLVSLQKLGLDCAYITDLSALSELTGVTWLILSSINGQDFSALKDMDSLKRLSMCDSTFADLDEVVRCLPASLVDLRLTSSGIKDIAPLSSLTGLEVLHLNHNEIRDLDPLSSLSSLKELVLSYNRIVDLTPLAYLTQLEKLNIEGNLVTEVSFETTTYPSESMLMAFYKAVLQGNMEFRDTAGGKSWNMNQVKEMAAPGSDIVVSPSHFSVVDLDADGAAEVIVALDIGGIGTGEYLVLRHQSGVVYGYRFAYREFSEIRTDGTFWNSGGASNVRICRVAFDKDDYMIDPITGTVYHASADNDSMTYFVEHQEATEEEWSLAVSKWNEIPYVEWYEYTEENIDRLLGV